MSMIVGAVKGALLLRTNHVEVDTMQPVQTIYIVRRMIVRMKKSASRKQENVLAKLNLLKPLDMLPAIQEIKKQEENITCWS